MNRIHRIIIFSFSFLLVCTGISAQQPKVKWGATVSDEKQTNFYIMGEDESSVYLLRFQHDKRNMSIPFFVTLSRKTLEVTKSTEMQIPIPDEGDARIHNVYYLKDRFILMISLTNYKTHLDRALAYSMNKKGEIDPNYKIVLETSAPAKGYNRDYHFLIAPDSSHFIGFVDADYDCAAASFDPELNLLWKATFNLKTETHEKYERNLAFGTDNNNDLFILIKATSKFTIENEPSNILYVYKHSEKKWNHYEIKPPGKDVAYMDAQMVIDQSGNVRCINQYGEKDTDAHGFLVTTYKDGQVHTVNNPFSPKFYSAFMSDSKAAKETKEDYLNMDDVVLNKDGSFEVVLHKYAPRVFVAAVVTKFDQDGKEVWSAPLPIYYWLSGEYFTYQPMLTDKEICFLHNDHKRNTDIIDPRESTGVNGLNDCVSVLTRVNLQTGKVTKQKLFDQHDLETYVIPRKCYQSSVNEMLLFAKRKGDVNFGKLTIE